MPFRWAVWGASSVRSSDCIKPPPGSKAHMPVSCRRCMGQTASCLMILTWKRQWLSPQGCCSGRRSAGGPSRWQCTHHWPTGELEVRVNAFTLRWVPASTLLAGVLGCVLERCQGALPAVPCYVQRRAAGDAHNPGKDVFDWRPCAGQGQTPHTAEALVDVELHIGLCSCQAMSVLRQHFMDLQGDALSQKPTRAVAKLWAPLGGMQCS